MYGSNCFPKSAEEKLPALYLIKDIVKRSLCSRILGSLVRKFLLSKMSFVGPKHCLQKSCFKIQTLEEDLQSVKGL